MNAVTEGRSSGATSADGALAVAPTGGLTTSEAARRLRRGEGNTPVTGTSRSYANILRTNVFSSFNVVLFVIGAALLALGRYNDAFISVGLGLLNALISAIQEMRAKRKLDALQLLDEAQVRVLRDGVVVEVVPGLVVRGDVVIIGAGDQIVVDGPLEDGGEVEVDESLLTGESDPIMKRSGDELRSGSVCIGGHGQMLAGDVGAGSYAGRLTADARRHTTDRTPLQRRIAFVVRLVIVLTLLMGGAILAQALLEGFTLLRTVQITAVLSGLVPYGLFTLIAVAYTAGAVRIFRHGALVQQVNAVEAISHVDVVCTDKTGTLTTGRLTVAEVLPLGGRAEADARLALGSFAHGVTQPNLTTSALAAGLPGEGWVVSDEIAFASATRWSGLVTDRGVWVLGAPDALPGTDDPALRIAVDERTGRGLRVLVLARAGGATGLRSAGGAALLPDTLAVVALVALADELRDDVAVTIGRFADEGVALKVISGDDPRTVAALAVQAGLPDQEPVRGSDLDDVDESTLDVLVESTSAFGRVSPEQKERIVGSLRRQGHYVAMIGDGLNDARALKAAQVGVAMRSGSAVTRDVADMVLTDDSFAALLPAQNEGRKIINGIASSLYVFLTRVTTQALVIVTITMLGLGFPYSPTQVGMTLFTVGLPTLFLTWWAGPDRPDPDLLRSVARFVVPASLITGGFGIAIYAALYTRVYAGMASGLTPETVRQEFERYTGLAYTDPGFATASATIGAQTGLTTFVSFASVLMILFIAPPHRLLAAWTRATGDWRPTVMVAVLLALLSAVLFIPTLSTYFGLTQAAGPVYDLAMPGLVVWFIVLYACFRFRAYDRVLGLEDLPRR